ncbi:MAG: SURF1 family protein [Xanthobacteraceae bacterium]
MYHELRKRGTRRGFVLPGIVVLAALVVLLGLGTWQLERKAWKEALIATLDERLAAPPADVPARTTWDRLDRSGMEFRRVRFSAELLHDQEALVYTSGSALRSDVSGPGYWVFTPARLTHGSIIVVNRGFVPEGRQDPASRAAGQTPGVSEIIGALRWPESRGLFTPADNPARNLWFVRDHLAMAAAKNWGPVAPFFVDQEAPPPTGGLPRVGKIAPNLRNDHLQYALTWYALAGVLAAVFLLWLRSRAKEAPVEGA